MRLKEFRQTGHLRVKTYIFVRHRLQADTECYKIWLEDADGYIQIERSTLETEQWAQVQQIADMPEVSGYPTTMIRINSETGERLWGA